MNKRPEVSRFNACGRFCFVVVVVVVVVVAVVVVVCSDHRDVQKVTGSSEGGLPRRNMLKVLAL